MPVPTYKDLVFYHEPAVHKQRFQQLLDGFKDRFGDAPEFVTRSPGRVNLMGDHIDYAYFPVFPMAIENDVLAAVSTSETDASIIIRNTDPQFATESFALPKTGSLLEIDVDNFSWGNYFKCGFIVAQKYIEEKNPGNKLKGLRVLFNGTVPTGGGLSSSAAFCVTSAMLVLRANGIKYISKSDLTRITVVTEHYVGVNTGGMDQCASIYGEKGKALLVTFQPKLEGIPFTLPSNQNLVFLITNSLITANKKETAPVNYNLRAVEAAVVAEVLAAKFNLTLTQDSNLNSGELRGFMDAFYISQGEKAWANEIEVGIKRLDKMIELLEQVFDTDDKKSGYTIEQASEAIGVSEGEFTKKFLTSFPVRFKVLKLYQRAKHIFSEAKRVLELIALLENPKNDSINEIGKLFNESHQSLRNLYETVPPQMDKMIKIASENGAIGSRVTGAGFGGSVVHILTNDKLQTLVNALKNNYYKAIGSSPEDIESAITVTKPGEGTCIIEL